MAQVGTVPRTPSSILVRKNLERRKRLAPSRAHPNAGRRASSRGPWRDRPGAPRPVLPLRRVGGEPRIVQPAPIQKLDGPIRPRRPQHRRDTVDDRPQLIGALVARSAYSLGSTRARTPRSLRLAEPRNRRHLSTCTSRSHRSPLIPRWKASVTACARSRAPSTPATLLERVTQESLSLGTRPATSPAYSSAIDVRSDRWT